MKSWFLIELITSILSIWILLRYSRKSGIVNFHVAYPNLTFVPNFLLKKYNVFVIEHWSAYHFNFGVKHDLKRIKKIFKKKFKLITVSKALGEDINQFLGFEKAYKVIPNIVDDEIYYPPAASQKRSKYFFMAAGWRFPKEPLIVINAFKEFLKKNSDYQLIIAGEGPLVPQMHICIKELGIEDKVEFLGNIKNTEVALHLRNCKALLLPTGYETFSVICAEAGSCSTPLIASNVGAIPELDLENLLLSNNTIEEWVSAMNKIIDIEIKESQNKFNVHTVGKSYAGFLKNKTND